MTTRADPFIQRSFRGLPLVGTAASNWGTLEFFAKILYAEDVSFETYSGGAIVGRLGGDAPLRAAVTGDVGFENRPEDLLFLVPLGFIGVGAFYLLCFNTVRECTVGTGAILLYSSRRSWYFWSGSI